MKDKRNLLAIAVALVGGSLMAQDTTIPGNLTVNGTTDVLAGPLTLGTVTFEDNSSNQTFAAGLSIGFSEVPQTWSGGNYVPGRAVTIHRVGHELAEFV